jgi:RNA polymerase sigma factor (sigma-70 family)
MRKTMSDADANELFRAWAAVPNARTLNTLMQKLRPSVLRVVRKMIGSRWPNEIEDVAQEALEKVSKTLATFRHECAIESWAYHQAAYAVKKLLKDRRRRKSDLIDSLEELEEFGLEIPDDGNTVERQIEAQHGEPTLQGKFEKVVEDLEDNPRARAVLLAAWEHWRLSLQQSDLPLRGDFIDDAVGLTGNQQQTARQAIKRRFLAFGRRRDDPHFETIYQTLFPIGGKQERS